MTRSIQQLAAAGLLISFAALVVGCVAGVGYGVDVGYAPGYIESPGYYEYGGWGGDYRVGPSRGGERRSAAAPSRGYRPAPASRPTPSIPSRSRGHGH